METRISRSRSTPRLIFRCFCIGGNALTALGAFTFPIISPDLEETFRMTQMQLASIVLAGIIGQYPFATVAGALVDRVGTWASSGCAAALFAAGYGTFVWMLGRHVQSGAEHLSPLAFRIMVASYFMLGVGNVFSYFSSIFTASKEFPYHNGLALGTTLALFGLSPLFLSLPSYLFIQPSGYVDARAYIMFLGIIVTIMHVISIFGLRGDPPEEPVILPQTPHLSPILPEPDELSPLIPKSDTEHYRDQTWLDVIKDHYFWWVFLITVTVIGSAEMVIGNIGTVVTSLLSSSAKTSQAVSNQVQLLSVCNTGTRLLAGPLIDWFCPNPLVPERRKPVSRFIFMAFAAGLMTLSYGYMGFLAQSNDHTWVLSAGVGIAYGMAWTILPTLVKSMWGSEHHGRNFGMMAYAPFFGTTLWTALFAFNVEHNKDTPGSGTEKCVGSKCWRTTFQICFGVLLAALMSVYGLWRRWRTTV